jgi:heat shock protein HtpX
VLKRIFLFLLTNILVIAMISFVTSALGLGPYLTQYGINYQSLAVFCAIWGMGGAFISLLLSKQMAKWSMGVQVIPERTQGGAEGELLRVVARLAQAAGLPKTPEVGVYNSPEVNAFATGPSKGNALVAVSSGLLRNMERGELEGVLGHEIAHVANGDMVTMTLIQGVVNAFTMFFARIVGFAVANAMRGENDDRRPNYFVQQMLVWVFDILFGLLGSIVVLWFSRQREFRADRGGAQYAGREKMIGALRRLQSTHDMVANDNQAVAALKIAGKPKGFVALFMSHPPLEQRIERLQRGA